jgi:hypothetical protein
MRIAIQNSLPNHTHIAEVEWMRRFFTACGRLGFEPIEVITSDDIMRCQPDCVLVNHEFGAKLTPFPTFGLNWSPPAFYAEDRLRRRALLSLDGYLCGSPEIARWIDDFVTGNGKRALISDSLMLPSAPDSGPAAPLPPRPAIMYAGTLWDGSRHGEIFRGLDGRVSMKLYGPTDQWAQYGESYGGILPFDGVSVIRAIRDAGIALCLHKAVHRAANCPSMRLFEAAAAGALIICDDFAFPREWFRDSILYVDAQLPARFVIDQIEAHVRWATENRAGAYCLAQRSNEVFRSRLTLERMLAPLPEFVDRVRHSRGMVAVAGSSFKPLPTVEYVVRIGSRPAETVARALDSLTQQTYHAIAVIVVQFHPVEGIEAVIEQYRSHFVSIRHVIVANNGNRSTAWWAGLNAIRAPFFGMLDDDDTIHPNHVASLMALLDDDLDCGFVYSGLIRVEDEPGHYVTGPQFNGPAGRVIEETRELCCIEREDFVDLLPTRNVIGHNSWICRASLLNAEVLVDPKIEWAEDVYFMVLMSERTKMRFTAAATASWHWRSTARDNWTLSHTAPVREKSLARWQERLQKINLPVLRRVSPPASQDETSRAVSEDVS